MTYRQTGKKSEKNSSRTALAIGETFTGEWEDCSMHDSVSFALRSDVACSACIEFTSDLFSGVIDSSLDYSISANINEVHRLTVTRQFFRIKVTNIVSTQTYLSLSTMVGTHAQLSAPINLSLGLDSDAIATRGTDFSDEVVIGKRSGVSAFNKFAYRTGLTAAAGFETIWSYTGGNFTVLTTASTFTITYNNATDGVATTGARSLQITYLDADGLDVVASHTLGSTGSDVTTFTGLGINRVVVLSSGTATCNNNNITITATTGGTVQAFVAATESVTNQAIFHVDQNSVAVGKLLFVLCNKLSGGGSPRVTIRGYVYNRGTATRYQIFRALIDTSSTSSLTIDDRTGFRLSSGDVLYFGADTDTNGTEVDIRFSLIEYRKN